MMHFDSIYHHKNVQSITSSYKNVLSFIWKSKYLSPSHFLDSVESWSFSCWLKWHTIGGYLHVFVYVIVLVRKIQTTAETESWEFQCVYKSYRKYNMVLKSSNLETKLIQKNDDHNFLCQWNGLNIFVTIEETKI